MPTQREVTTAIAPTSVHVAGPEEREHDPDSPTGRSWVQRCLRCDELLWRVRPVSGGGDEPTGAPRLRVGGLYKIVAREHRPDELRPVSANRELREDEAACVPEPVAVA